MKVALIAGESSGDNLGASLIRELRTRVPDLHCVGVAGPRMKEAGCEAWHGAEELAVMGLVEILREVPRLLRLRRDILDRLRANPPDVLIGIDAPEFNIGLERRAKALGIKTVHYVSPSVWVWRPDRVHDVAAAADLLLTLLPFEPAYYEASGPEVCFVGHPLADELADPPARSVVRERLGLDPDAEVLAVLPGSRRGEISRIGPCFVDTLRLLVETRPCLEVLAPMADRTLAQHLSVMLEARGIAGKVRLLDGQAQDALRAADMGLIASGTATLEAMLLGCPMVVAYRLAPVTLWLLETLELLQIDRFSLPNLLAGEMIVPEFMQGEMRAETMAKVIAEGLDDPSWREAQRTRFAKMAGILRHSASAAAADAVIRLVEDERGG